MKVLVAYASRHGSTKGIAERIAAGLCDAGLSAEAESVDEVHDLNPYDAFVIGSAAYMFHWLRDATTFVKRHQSLLSQRPVWLFSSGPLGTELVDEEGRDILEATRPREFDELSALIHPQGERVFFGAWDADARPVGLGERLLRLMPAARAATPSGDSRDWDAIDGWATDIASHLRSREEARR